MTLPPTVTFRSRSVDEIVAEYVPLAVGSAILAAQATMMLHVLIA